uniref:Uncharacterized protein n=1 Tax=Lygus hesperus TaxID=30085 RepID=A0A0A9XIV9_LYGHE
MREVEQVLNATNAGLIDTLDKSLSILRDMLDGKANKQDIAALQQMMNEEGSRHKAADALTGFKGFRCLGCNRPVDNLRPRPLPAKLTTFVNRTPQNYPSDEVTRTIQQSAASSQSRSKAPESKKSSHAISAAMSNSAVNDVTNAPMMTNIASSNSAPAALPLPPID